MKRIVLLAATVTLTACVRPEDHPISTNCVWTEEDDRALNLENAADRRHLRDDAITAEDMAIRWADTNLSLWLCHFWFGRASSFSSRQPATR